MAPVNDTPATRPGALIVKITKIVEKLINTNQLTGVMKEQLTA